MEDEKEELIMSGCGLRVGGVACNEEWAVPRLTDIEEVFCKRMNLLIITGHKNWSCTTVTVLIIIIIIN